MRKILFTMICLVMLSGCAAVTVEHQGQLAGDEKERKTTYGWLDKSVPGNDIRVNNPAVGKMVRHAVEERLLQMGYQKVAAEKADYLLAWFGTVTEEMEEMSVSRFYANYGYSTLVGEMPKNIKKGKVRKLFTKGTLIIDVLDREGKKVIWRGSATNTLLDDMDRRKAAIFIDTSVEEILKGLPGK